MSMDGIDQLNIPNVSGEMGTEVLDTAVRVSRKAV